tara:strand:- start:167 stop:679 length:513 start_codon:yes stop_codon:yes gene_type:complete
MLREDFFYKFMWFKRENSDQIIRYNSNRNLNIQNQINSNIIDIDQKISENSKALVEAQIVKLRSTFTKSNNFIESIGKNIYKQKIEDSINWHEKELKELYFKRKILQINLEKIKGIFWINRIKRFLKLILISFFILLSILIFLSGFMIIIYLLPIIIIIFLGYVLTTKKY